LFLSFIVLAITPLLLAGVLVTRFSFTIQKQRAIGVQREIARQVAARIEEYVLSLDSELRLVNDVAGLMSQPVEQQRQAMQALHQFGAKPFEELTLLDASGRVLVRVGLAEGQGAAPSASRAGADEFLIPKNHGRVFFGPVRFDAASRKPLLTMSRPLFDRATGAFQGVLVAETRLNKLAELVAGFEPARVGQLYVLDAEGRIVAHRNDLKAKADMSFMPPAVDGIGRGLTGALATIATGVAKLGGQTLTVVAERPVLDALGMAVNTLWSLIALVLASSLAALILAYFVIRRIVRPLQDLSGTVRAVSRGAFSQRATESGDEIGELAHAFNLMTVELERTMHGLQEKIQELTRTQARLSESERRYRDIYELSSEGVILCGLNGSLREANPQACNYLGYETDEFLGFTGKDLIHPDDLSSNPLDTTLKTVCTGQTVRLELRAKHKDGHWITADVGIKRVGDDLMQVMFRDISLRKQMESEILKAKTAAEDASRAKGQFLANMSHEIRTPLGCIIGISELTLEADPRPDQKENLEMILDSAVSLLDIINDILDYTKIEANKLKLSHKDFHLRKTLEKTLKTFATHASRKSDTLHFEIKNDLPALVKGDSGRLTQIIRNLVGNAVKFTENGSIRLSVENTTPDTWPAVLSFEIKDTGIGIPLDQLDQLFHIFSQVDSSYAMKYSGTGLGLAISKELVGMMGGSIWVQSEKGVGSSFSFTAVFDAPDQTAAAPSLTTIKPQALPSTAKYPRRILFAEDNKVNSLFITDFLLRAGHQVVAVSNGVEALNALEHAETAFDLVLMDIQMPEMDGVEATRRIRSGETPNVDREIPIIALTAYAMREDKERFFAAGINGCITKPVERSGLLKTLDEFFETELPPQARLAPGEQR